jgi:myo-inositol-1-phosphate synthase
MVEQKGKKVRVAIIGVGNCASSLVQGVEFYKDAKETDTVPGLMHVNLGGYHIHDLEFSAAFDVVDAKVGLDLNEAIAGRIGVAIFHNMISLCPFCCGGAR